MGRACAERHWRRGCLGRSNTESQHPLLSSGLRNKALAQAVPQPRLPTPCSTPGSPLQLPLLQPGRAETAKEPECSPKAMAGPRGGAPRPALCKQEKQGRLLSFPENFWAGQREPLSLRLPGLLPRPVAQVSHAVPVSQPAFSLCLWDHRVLALAPFSDTSPAPFGLRSLTTVFLK